MAVVNINMTCFIKKELDLSDEDANYLRIDYWKRYGSTVRGLVENHGVSMKNFLSLTHKLSSIAPLIDVQKKVARVIRRLPGKKYVVTNSPKHYAYEVLRIGNLLRCFDGVYSVEDMVVHRTIKCKPARLFWQKMLNGIGCERKKVVVVDDSLTNLKTAKIAGFTTVWMRKFIFKDPRKKKVFKPSYVDYVIRSFDALIQNNFDG